MSTVVKDGTPTDFPRLPALLFFFFSFFLIVILFYFIYLF